MPMIEFDAADVKHLADHSVAAPRQAEQVVDYDSETGAPITQPVPAPALVLVHDDGVYLMSNGLPEDKVAPDSNSDARRHVAYARGCNPKQDGAACWDNARAAVGGDDFAEVLPWAREVKAAIDGGAKKIVLDVREGQIALVAA